MHIKDIPLLEGELPNDDHPQKRYVIAGVTNGSTDSTRTVARLTPHTKHSDSVIEELERKYSGVTFKKLASGRIEKVAGDDELVIYRGTDRFWDPSFEGANILRLLFKGTRIRSGPPPPGELEKQTSC